MQGIHNPRAASAQEADDTKYYVVVRSLRALTVVLNANDIVAEPPSIGMPWFLKKIASDMTTHNDEAASEFNPFDDVNVTSRVAVRVKSNGKGNGQIVGGVTIEAGVKLHDFFAYMPAHQYIFEPTREMWPASSVDARLSLIPKLDADGDPVLTKEGKQAFIPASAWLDINKPVEQMTWAPGEASIIRDRIIQGGGWVPRDKLTVFNLYRPPIIKPGDAALAGKWRQHVEMVFGDTADHIVKWLAYRVQRPDDKINHALVLGGMQGIGKDTLLEPVKYAIGPWNFTEASPQQMQGRFNSFIKSVILRVSEARDLGESSRYQFYEHCKQYIAAPPDVLRCDEKHLREHAVLNCTGVVITTNHKVDGIFLPADDRRHFVAWSSLTKDDFSGSYWNDLWAWYKNGGIWHVAAYLARLDLASFDPKAPPRKTEAFFEIVNANRAPEDSELADVLDGLGRPDVVTIDQVIAKAYSLLHVAFSEWLKDRKNSRSIPHRFEDCDYTAVRNPHDTEGRWKISGKRHTIYGKKTLTERHRINAATQFVRMMRDHH